MSFQSKNLPLPINIPDKWEDAKQFLQEYIRQAAEGIAQSESGVFSTQAQQSGQTFAGTEGFRKLVQYNVALPNSATSSAIPSGIQSTGTLYVTNLRLIAKDNATDTMFTAMGNSLGNDALDIYMVDRDIFIRTTQDYSAFTNNYIVIEYLITA